MDVTRDDFERPVPHNLIAKFRDRPSAVCPLCEGRGTRRDGKIDRICDLCNGHGSLTTAQLKVLNPDVLEIIKGFQILPKPELLVESNGHSRERKAKPVTA